jgi:hypothetical protein
LAFCLPNNLVAGMCNAMPWRELMRLILRRVVDDFDAVLASAILDQAFLL